MAHLDQLCKRNFALIYAIGSDTFSDMDELTKLISKLDGLKGQWPTLAYKAGVSQATIWRICNRRVSPSWDTMQALNKACDKINRSK